MKEGGCTNAYTCICKGTHSLSYRTDWLMWKYFSRDEVLMTLYTRLGFSARSALRLIQGGAKIGQWGAPSPKDFFFRSEWSSNEPNASSYPELKCHNASVLSAKPYWDLLFLSEVTFLSRFRRLILLSHCKLIFFKFYIGFNAVKCLI